MRYCKNCGSILKQPYKFCSNCGCSQQIINPVDEERVNLQKTENCIDERSLKQEDNNDIKRNDTYSLYNGAIKRKLIIGKICESVYK